jgi:calcium permeable stress-gated cation channel
MLLKIFIPLSLLLLPLLLSLNAIGGRGPDFVEGIYAQANNKTPNVWQNQNGLNQLAWGNIRPTDTNRYWAHCFCAIIVVVYCCYVFFDELQGYVRLRQAYLTSPQHRLRASATTVLVSAIPRKWCTAEALEGLYDVFPGGIRNIWINRNFDELNEKVQRRDDIASKLEEAQTNLIKMARKEFVKNQAKEAKKAGQKKTKSQKHAEKKEQDRKAAAMAEGEGTSAGDPHQVHHTVDEELYENESIPEPSHQGILPKVPVVGRGLEVVESGITNLGRTVLGGIRNVGRGVDNVIASNQGLESSREDLTQAQSQVDPFNEPGIPQYDGAVSSITVPNNEVELQSTSKAEAKKENLHNNEPAFGETQTVSSEMDKEIGPRPQSADSYKINTVPLHGKTKYAFWRQSRNAVQVPEPFPHGYQENKDVGLGTRQPPKKFWEFWKKPEPAEEYPDAYDKDYNPNSDDALWRRYVKEKDRETMRLPIFGIEALSWLPFVGQKVDTIDYCRKELARLNLEIEQDQKEPEKYPLMNSAFIQFNHQVAAHMACQAVSHHIPMQMAPRAVEIAPKDVIWDNMSIRWWERWARTFWIIALVFGLIIGWAVPVAFTGVVSNLDNLSHVAPWLQWVTGLPNTAKSIIQGILPPALLALLLFLLPIVLRILAKLQGVGTGTAVELAVQWYYFAFLFVQVFLIVTVSSSIPYIIGRIKTGNIDIQFVPNILASTLPNAANYFFSYMILQALSTSAGVLLQVGGLLGWFILGPLFDSTARQKWRRQVQLPNVQWGTFFPVYTNFACIGLVYCTVAPLMLVFLLITFGLFWFVYRYQTLYITRFTQDTGGLLFPNAINQLFVGLYVMELCLFGLFLLVTNVQPDGQPSTDTPCQAQAIIMVVLLICTIIYQTLLNKSFGPLLRYLPITLEDDAVARDEEFARAQDKKFRLAEGEQYGDDINDILADQARRSEEENEAAQIIEMRDIEKRRSRHLLDPHKLSSAVPGVAAVSKVIPGGWAGRRASRQRSQSPGPNWVHEKQEKHAVDVNSGAERLIRQHKLRNAIRRDHDKEANHNDSIANALFAGINDEIEDLTPEERDLLVRRAFQHEALRARRPVIWIPRDDMGVSDDEIARTKRLSDQIWISNDHTGLDGKARVIYRKSPPDFSELDLIEL